MDVNWARAAIGAIVTNLQSLEFALRLFLAESLAPGNLRLDIHLLQPGESVAESYLTNYDSLRTIINKANRRLLELHRAERVDAGVVGVRDALAHGRVFALTPGGPYRIVKFGRPANGVVRVASVMELSEDRLKLEVKRSGDELLKVVRVSRELGIACFPND